MTETHKDTDIMFFDGTYVRESFDYITSDYKNEIAIFKIDTKDIPIDTLLSLRQIML